MALYVAKWLFRALARNVFIFLHLNVVYTWFGVLYVCVCYIECYLHWLGNQVHTAICLTVNICYLKCGAVYFVSMFDLIFTA